MRFNKHYLPPNRPHAILAPSKPHWIGYDDDKMERAFTVMQAAARGTELHALAAKMIEHRIKAADLPITFNMYVNDCIGYRMVPEQVLFYSENSYGTADALSWDGDKRYLRVFDYKSGVTPATFKQHMVYCALFCLEYGIKPFEAEFEMRIYQSNEIKIQVGEPDAIAHIMSQIKHLDNLIREMQKDVM